MGKLSFFAIQKYIYALLTACVPMQSVAQSACDFASNFQKPHMCCIANDGLETVALMEKWQILKSTRKDTQWYLYVTCF